MMPVVGLTTYAAQARYGDWDLEAALLPWRYIVAVTDAGGEPLLVPPVPQAWRSVLDVLDAVVLSGGPDIDPQMYGAMPQSNTVGVDRRRDEAELAIAVAAMKHDLPVLGICRGAQMMNIACGGTLYQHLPDVVGHSGHKGSAPGEFAAHEVIVCPDSRLDKIIGPSRSVLSRHHQGLAQLGAGLRAAAVAHDGSVEAIEHVSRRSLYLGVLWHAELDHGSGVFEALIEDAHRARTERSCKAAAEPNSEVWLTGGDRYASM